MELVRKIMLEVEKADDVIYNLKIDNYTADLVSYHCHMLDECRLINGYSAYYSNDELEEFSVGQLTWDGHDFLEKIRDDSLWGKTKDVIKKKGLPLIIDTIKTVSTAFIAAAAEGVANSILKNGTP